jgi:glyoxylase-like metal-dependent hydrolase (beta-lactamase superfamily II)
MALRADNHAGSEFAGGQPPERATAGESLRPTSRRAFLKSAASGIAGASLAGGIAGAVLDIRPGMAAGLAVTPLGDEISLLRGAGGNVLVIGGPGKAVLVDSGAPQEAKAVLAQVAGLAPRGVGTLFNTHWHPDHTGGNELFGKKGVAILAHENTRLWMGAEFRVEWQDRTYTPRPKAALPNTTFYASGEGEFGGRHIRYGHLPQAHTDGDIYIHLPEENILAAGDVVTVGSYPVLDYSTGGWIGGMTDATQTLLDIIDDKTRVIPGAGPAVTRTHVEAQFHMLQEMMKRIVTMVQKGMSPADMLAADVGQGFNETYGKPDQFVHNAYWGIWGHIREFANVV